MGYQFVNFDNWWKGTQNIAIADFNYYRNNAYLSSTTYDFIYFKTPILAISDRIFHQKVKGSHALKLKINLMILLLLLAQKKADYLYLHIF